MKTKCQLFVFIIIFVNLTTAKYYILEPKSEADHERKVLNKGKNNEKYLKIKVDPKNVVITPLEVRQLKSSEKVNNNGLNYNGFLDSKNSFCRGPVCIEKLLHNYNDVIKGSNKHGSKYLRSLATPRKKEYADYEYDYDKPSSDSDQEFKDLTRLKNPITKSTEVYLRNKKSSRFSSDYVDVSDLQRTFQKHPTNFVVAKDLGKNKFKDSQIKKKRNSFADNARRNPYIVVRASDSENSESSNEVENDGNNENSQENEKDSEEVANKKRKKRTKKSKKIKKVSTSEESSSNESEEDIPKRFEVINNKKNKKIKIPYKIFSEENTLEVSNEISTEITPKKKKKKNYVENSHSGKAESYIQGRDRIMLEDLRRRLQHFLPKRYHWDPDNFQKLGYFWFNGPQGRYPGPWRI